MEDLHYYESSACVNIHVSSDNSKETCQYMK